MRRNIVILGIIVSSIAAFSTFIGLSGEYVIGALGVILIVMGIPMTLIGIVLKNDELSSTRRCPKCSHEISFDAKVCPYCQYVLTDVLRHEY